MAISPSIAVTGFVGALILTGFYLHFRQATQKRRLEHNQTNR